MKWIPVLSGTPCAFAAVACAIVAKPWGVLFCAFFAGMLAMAFALDVIEGCWSRAPKGLR